MLFPRVCFYWSTGAIKIVYEPSLQETESDIARPDIPLSFHKQINILYADIIFHSHHGVGDGKWVYACRSGVVVCGDKSVQ